MKIQKLKVKIHPDSIGTKFKSFYFLLVFLIFTFYLLPLSKALAQETQRTITIIPPNVQKILNPGDKAEGVMKVINDSDVPLTFAVSTRDYIVVDTVGTPNFLPPNTLNKKFSAAAWIGVVPNSFTVLPHEKQLLNYYIQVPLDARPGGHYAGAVYMPANLAGVKGTGASVQTQVGTLFYISVAGPINELSMVTKFVAKPFSEYGPINISTEIKNFGDLHITPSGSVAVYDLLGRKLSVLPLQKLNVFPGSTRDFQNTFGQKLMLGRFKATLLASYGKNNNLPLLATVYFWVFPWKLATLIVLAAIAIVLGGMYWRRRKLQENTEQKTENRPPSSP